ncbi:MAG TPA: ABC transporter permease [Candidatus Sulfopaludibacter sp.]|jgi:predicted permease|nr:ABC transporter permease [Candidatus Sulfopaludibacter sp.]
MGRILSDVKFALRNLRRSPLFTVIAVASLALGIGANTAIFTLLDQLILRMLPVRDPQQLVMIWANGPHMGSNRGSRATSYPMYQDYQSKAQPFSYVFCRFGTPLSVNFSGQTERVEGELVSGNYFQALGVQPALGRVFSPDQDDRTYKGHPSVVLSYQYWSTRFASDPSVIGQKILINNYPMTIVGVSAPGFLGLDPANSPQIRVPIQMKPLMTPGWDDIGDRRSQWIQVFARLKPGYTLQSAQPALQTLFSQILRDELEQPQLRGASQYSRTRFLARKVRMEAAASGYSQLRQSYSVALIVLMCMVGLVLLIACFNVANLLIARAAARQKEVAVRLAIGASRAQLLGQLMIESMMLSVAGGAAGLLLSIVIVRALLAFLPTGGTPLMLRATPDLRILAFNAGLALFTGVLFGMAPALQSMRLDLWNTLKDVVSSVGGSGAAVKLRKGLVIAQVAFSFLLLVGAGLFTRTLANLKSTSSGIKDIDHLISFQVDAGLNGYSVPRLQAFYAQILQNVRAIPRVNAAGFAMVPILSGDEWDSGMSVEGHVNKDGEDTQQFMNGISPGYWKAMGIGLLEGRDFDERDRGTKTTVAIVNRAFAEHYFPGRSVIGRHIGFGDGADTKLKIEIIGMVENSLYEGPREGVHRQVFVPFDQSDYPGAVSFYVRSSADSATMFGALRNAVRQLDPAMPVYSMKTLEHQLDDTLSTERLIALLSAAFGILATLLAAMGLYGVMAFVVARRTREIGLRMALGAQRTEVVWMVMREALVLLGIGLAIGVPVSFWLARYVSSQLFSVRPSDIGTAIGALVILVAVTAAAGLFPARKASGIDPIRALRYE